MSTRAGRADFLVAEGGAGGEGLGVALGEGAGVEVGAAAQVSECGEVEADLEVVAGAGLLEQDVDDVGVALAESGAERDERAGAEPARSQRVTCVAERLGASVQLAAAGRGGSPAGRDP